MEIGLKTEGDGVDDSVAVGKNANAAGSSAEKGKEVRLRFIETNMK